MGFGRSGCMMLGIYIYGTYEAEIFLLHGVIYISRSLVAIGNAN